MNVFKFNTVDSIESIINPGFFKHSRFFLAFLHNDLCSVYVDIIFVCTWCLISSRYHVTDVYFEGPDFL